MEETDLPEMFCGLFAACRVAPEVEVDLDRAADRLALDYRSSSLGEGPGKSSAIFQQQQQQVDGGVINAHQLLSDDDNQVVSSGAGSDGIEQATTPTSATCLFNLDDDEDDEYDEYIAQSVGASNMDDLIGLYQNRDDATLHSRATTKTTTMMKTSLITTRKITATTILKTRTRINFFKIVVKTVGIVSLYHYRFQFQIGMLIMLHVS